MKIISWNCRGLGPRPTVRGLLKLQKEEDSDILFLSETKLDKATMEKFIVCWVCTICYYKIIMERWWLSVAMEKGKNVTLGWAGGMHIDVIVQEGDGFKWRLT